MPLFKVLAAGFAAAGLISMAGLVYTNFWLIIQVARERHGRGFWHWLHVGRVQAAATRGEFPHLASARWYRWFLRCLLISWIGGALSVMAHEVSQALR